MGCYKKDTVWEFKRIVPEIERQTTLNARGSPWLLAHYIYPIWSTRSDRCCSKHTSSVWRLWPATRVWHFPFLKDQDRGPRRAITNCSTTNDKWQPRHINTGGRRVAVAAATWQATTTVWRLPPRCKLTSFERNSTRRQLKVNFVLRFCLSINKDRAVLSQIDQKADVPDVPTLSLHWTSPCNATNMCISLNGISLFPGLARPYVTHLTKWTRCKGLH